jgi:hypothetical protein
MSSIIAKKNLEAELEFLKQLFYENLPIGDNTEVVDEYFSCLRKVIYSKDGRIEREEFPPDDPAVCGKREYRYYSADKFKELASGRQHPTLGQDLGYTESKSAELHAKQDHAAESKDMEYIQERSLFGGTFDADAKHHDFSGELDVRDTCELLNESTC